MIVLLIPLAAVAFFVGAAVRNTIQAHRTSMRRADRRDR